MKMKILPRGSKRAARHETTYTVAMVKATAWVIGRGERLGGKRTQRREVKMTCGSDSLTKGTSKMIPVWKFRDGGYPV